MNQTGQSMGSGSLAENNLQVTARTDGQTESSLIDLLGLGCIQNTTRRRALSRASGTENGKEQGCRLLEQKTGHNALIVGSREGGIPRVAVTGTDKLADAFQNGKDDRLLVSRSEHRRSIQTGTESKFQIHVQVVESMDIVQG